MTPKTASFTNIAAPYQAEMQNNAQEQQMLLEALQSQQKVSVAPTSAGRLSALNFDGVGNVLAEALTKKRLEAARKKQADTQGVYEKELRTAADRYMTERDGQTQTVAGPPEENGTPAQKIVPGNPLAFKAAALSRFPEIREMAGEDRKTQETIFGEAAKKANLDSLGKANGDVRKLAQSPDYIEANGSFFEKPQTAAGMLSRVPGMQVLQTKLDDGTLVNTFPGGKQSAVGGGNTTINNNMPGEKADTKFLETEAVKLSTRAETLRSSLPGGFRALASAEQAAQAGTLQGPVSGMLQTAAGLLREFNLAPEDTKRLLTNTELMSGGMSQFVLEALKKTGTNPSNTDREFVSQAVGGRQNSPEGLAALIRAARADMLNELTAHNQHVSKLSARVPSTELARLSVPTSNSVPGYAPDENGMLMPVAPGAKGKPKSRHSPEEAAILKGYGY